MSTRAAAQVSLPSSPTRPAKDSLKEDAVTKKNIVSPEPSKAKKAILTATPKTSKKKQISEESSIKNVALELFSEDIAADKEKSAVKSDKVTKHEKKSKPSFQNKLATEEIVEEGKEAEEGKTSSNSFQPRSKLDNCIEIPKKVELAYKVMSKRTRTLGGNGYNGAIYGELTIGSMQRVTETLVKDCEMNHSSRFIDVGAGLGKPNFHVAQYPEVCLSIGVELELIRWQVSDTRLDPSI